MTQAHAQPIYEADARQEFPSLAVFSIWFGVLLILFTAVTHLAVGERNQEWLQPFVTGFRFTLLTLLIASLGYLFVNAGSGIRWAILPLFINLGVVIILLFVPFNALWEELNFRWQSPNYTQIANMVEAGTIPVDVTGAAYLPRKYQHLSADNGRIQILRRGTTTEILFINQRKGNAFAGYIYVSDNTPPQTGDFNGRWRTLIQKQRNWFYVISDEK